MKLVLPKPKTLLDFGFFLMMIKVLFSASGVLPYNSFVDDLLSYLAVALLAFHMVLKRYSFKTLLLYGAITVVSLYSTLITKQYGLLITIVSCLALRGEKFDKAIYFIFSWETFFLILHTIYAIFYSIVAKNELYGIYYGELRYHFGFAHPNMFSIYLFNLILMWIWLNYSHLKIRNLFVIFAISLLAQVFTKTRTSLISMAVILLIILWLKTYKKSGIIKYAAMFVTPILAAMEFVACKIYTTGNSIVLFMDKLLSARIRLGAYAYNNYGISLLGQDMNDINVIWDSFWQLSGFTFDCTYTFLMINQGIIWLLIIIAAFYFLAKRGTEQVWVMIIAWSLYAVTEVHGLNSFKCFPILLIALCFNQNNSKYIVKV